MLIRTPTQARQKVADDVDRVTRVRGERQAPPPVALARRRFVVARFSVVVHGDLTWAMCSSTTRSASADDRLGRPALMTLPSTWPHLMVFGEEGLAKLLLTYEAAGGRVWPRLAHHIAERLAFGAVTYALFALDSGNEVPRCGEGAARRNGMSERRYSPLATLFAATFLFRIGNAVAALALPWFVLSHTKSAAGRAPRPLQRHRDHHRRVGWWWPRRSVQGARVALISGVVGGVAGRASHCSMPLAPSRTLG
ncbi:mph(A)_2_U36578 [Klebsiella pneumoniae]|nr:mph(A)_2_U36578 [Klebsiella pneumoniae]